MSDVCEHIEKISFIQVEHPRGITSKNESRPNAAGAEGSSYRFWYDKSCPRQAFSRSCEVIATVSYTHRVPTLGEDGVGKHSPF